MKLKALGVGNMEGNSRTCSRQLMLKVPITCRRQCVPVQEDGVCRICGKGVMVIRDRKMTYDAHMILGLGS